MKTIEIDDELYQYLASQTETIGESASAILRRLLQLESKECQPEPREQVISQPSLEPSIASPTLNVPEDKPSEPMVLLAEESPQDDVNAPDVSVNAVQPNDADPEAIETIVDVQVVSDAASEVANSRWLSVMLDDPAWKQCQSSTKRFLFLLGEISRHHNEQFAVVEQIKGSGRVYFAKDESTLLASGSSTKPKPIPHSDYWVMTNSNTTRKKNMVARVCDLLGYSSFDIEPIVDLI